MNTNTKQLTNREKEILQLLASGVYNSEIAQKLNISISTVQNHAHKIYKKLGVRNRTEAARKFQEQKPNYKK
ncbi:MAG: response regulator transcription factor [Anaerolineae bacterium]|nr:response regulator transcription factor [Anaerolineae bacterium]